MNKSITQATQNDKQISKSIKRFFTRFHNSSVIYQTVPYSTLSVPKYIQSVLLDHSVSHE